MLQYGSSSRVGRGFSNGSRMTCGRSRGGGVSARDGRGRESARVRPSGMILLREEGGARDAPVPVSPDTAPARTVSSETSLVSASGSRRDSIVACAGRARDTSTRARRTLPCVVALAGREKSSKTRDRGSGETAKAVITVNSTEAARSSAFFFLSRKGLVFQIGTAAVIFFFAAPICRCRDAGKRKFDGETKTSVDRRSQNRALTDRRSDENENLSDFLVEKVSIKVTWKENRCQSQRAGKETGLTPEPGFMSPRFRPIFGFHARYLETLEEILREG